MKLDPLSDKPEVTAEELRTVLGKIKANDYGQENLIIVLSAWMDMCIWTQVFRTMREAGLQFGEDPEGDLWTPENLEVLEGWLIDNSAAGPEEAQKDLVRVRRRIRDDVIAGRI